MIARILRLKPRVLVAYANNIYDKETHVVGFPFEWVADVFIKLKSKDGALCLKMPVR